MIVRSFTDMSHSNLYYGQNALLQQTVLTWVATSPNPAFVADIAPLITGLSQFPIPNNDYPQNNVYLGYMGLGSEAYWSNQNVTFSVPKLSFDITTK